MDHYAAYSGVQYSPLDMAEYVFWTGDEKGVTTAIEEFLQDGMVRPTWVGYITSSNSRVSYWFWIAVVVLPTLILLSGTIQKFSGSDCLQR